MYVHKDVYGVAGPISDFDEFGHTGFDPMTFGWIVPFGMMNEFVAPDSRRSCVGYQNNSIIPICLHLH